MTSSPAKVIDLTVLGPPQWQVDQLAEHRRQRASQNAESNQIVWTRVSVRTVVTEVGSHWAQVNLCENATYMFIAYDTDSGELATSWFNYDTEQKAMEAALAFMLHGRVPGKLA